MYYIDIRMERADVSLARVDVRAPAWLLRFYYTPHPTTATQPRTNRAPPLIILALVYIL